MVKDFDTWNKQKKNIHDNHAAPLFQEREMWWCSVGENIGVEIDGKHELYERPVMVFKKCGPEMFLGLPITSKPRDSRPYFFTFSFAKESRTLIFSQIRVFSAKRLIRRIGKVSDSQFDEVAKGFQIYMHKETDPLRGPRVPNGNE